MTVVRLETLKGEGGGGATVVGQNMTGYWLRVRHHCQSSTLRSSEVSEGIEGSMGVPEGLWLSFEGV